MLRSIQVVLSANSTSFAAQMRTASMGVRQFGDDAVNVATRTDAASRRTLDTVGKLGLALGAGLVVALGASVMAAANFEKEMRNVASISPNVQRNFDKIGDSLVDMSREMPQSAKVLAKGLYDITSSGFDGAEAMVILKSSALAASAGLTDTATSAKAITAVLNAYGMEARDAGYVSDVLFATVVKGVINFEDLTGVIGDTVGTAAAAGVEIHELGAAVATMTLSGISAAEAGTSLNRVMTSFIDPSEAMIAHLKAQGYESGVAALEALGLEGAMEMLRTTTGGNIETLVKLFPEQRAARGALALMSDEGRNAADVFGALGDKTKVLGMTQAAYNEQSKSFSFQLEVAKNNAVALAIEVGSALLPALTSLLQLITGVLQGFSDLPGPVKTAIGVLALVTGVVGAVGGAFLLLAPRIAAAQALMASTAAKAPALASGLGMVAKGAGLVGLALTAFTFVLAQNAQAKARLTAVTNTLVDALKAERQGQKGAVDAAIAAELAKRGLIDKAEKLGVSLDLVARAARGDVEAMNQIKSITDGTGISTEQLAFSIDKEATSKAKARIEADKFVGSLGEVANGMGKATSEIEDEEKALNAANPALAEQRDKLAEVERILGPMADGLGTATEKIEKLNEIQKAYNDSMGGFADGAGVYKSVLDDLQSAQRSENEEAIAGIDKRIEAIRKQKGLSDEAKESQISGLEEQKAALQEFTASADISLAQYNAGLEKQIAAAKEWSANYATIFRTFGPEVARILASMGEEGRIIAAKMTADLEGEGKRTAELLPPLYGMAGEEATIRLHAGLAPSPVQTRQQAQAVEQAVKDHIGPLPGWTGEQATALTNFLQTNLAPATPNTAAQAEATANALRTALASLPGWTQERANELVGFLQNSLSPMPGQTAEQSEATANALRERLAGLPGWTQEAANRTVDQWVSHLAKGTGGTGAETAAWAKALVAILNQILSGVGAGNISLEGYYVGNMAKGGILGGGAAGGPENHVAQIAPAGAWRVWAEDETGGEAYIPLAPQKRHRSVEILRQVADRFGMTVAEYAYGGVLDDQGVPLPPTAAGWGHMLGHTNERSDRKAYDQARAWVIEQKRIAAEKAAAASSGGGEPYTGGNIGSGWQQITGYLDSKGVPYTITSTYRAGDPGFHGRGKAVDLVGDMARIFNTLAAGNPVPGINELFFDPMGYFYDNGGRAGGAIGGHDDHVHAATFDRGGWLMPGFTLAHNGTGRPELVSRFANGGYANTGQMSISRQSTGATGSVMNTTNITSLAGAAGRAGSVSYGGLNRPEMGRDTGDFLSRVAYRLITGQRAVYDDDLDGRPDAWGNASRPPPGSYDSRRGGFGSRLAYRMITGQRGVYDDNLNGRPDAWENGRPPGAVVGMGGGGSASTSVDASINISPGAFAIEVRVSPGANTSAVEEAVRRALGPALQDLTGRLSRQVRARIAV